MYLNGPVDISQARAPENVGQGELQDGLGYKYRIEEPRVCKTSRDLFGWIT